MFQGRFKVRYGKSWYTGKGVLTTGLTVSRGGNNEGSEAYSLSRVTASSQPTDDGTNPVVAQGVKDDACSSGKTCEQLQGTCSQSSAENIVMVWDYETREVIIEKASCIMDLKTQESSRSRPTKRRATSGQNENGQSHSKEKQQKNKSPRQIINALSRNPEYRKQIESSVRNPGTNSVDVSARNECRKTDTCTMTSASSNDVPSESNGRPTGVTESRPTYVPQMRSRPDFREITRPGAASTEANNRRTLADPRESSLFIPRQKVKPASRYRGTSSSKAATSQASTSETTSTSL